MKTKMKTFVSMIAIICLLAAFLTGCGSTQIAETSESAPDSQQEDRQEPSQDQKNDKKTDAPEMKKAETTEDIADLLQTAMDAVAVESDLWAISEITDAEVLMQLTQLRVGKERSEGEGSTAQERKTSPDGDGEQKPGREKPDGTMPERSGENRSENKDGTFPEGKMPEGGQGRGEGGRQSGNRGGGMSGLAIVISCTEDATLSTENIFTQIQLTAEELGYQASSMELTEEQQSVIEVPDGYSVKLVVLINTQMPEREE